MFPYLYQSPSVAIGSYGVMLAVAYLTGRYVYISNIERRIKQPVNTEALIIALLVFGVIGAKLMFIMKNPNIASFSWSSITAGSGFSSQGAIFAAIIVTVIFSKLSKVKLSQLLDAAAPGAVLAYAIARIGCFLAGDDCWGIDTQLPWSMSFPNGIHKTSPGQTVHPVPLYEMIYSLIIWHYLNISQNREKRPYYQFFKLLLLWGICRFLIEFVSTNPVKMFSMSGSQFGALLMFVVATAFFSYQHFQTHKKKPGKSPG
jgi:phosphatidylglycerol---prolipoprotein diacylglyceryl transferase